jgi:nitrogen-specific signal transduction histidine kinase
MNQKDYNAIHALKNTDTKNYQLFLQLQEKLLNELSFASHEIKNQLSFMRCSYQFISHKYPEAVDFSYWTSLGDSIDALTRFMDRTSLYRYSTKASLKQISLNDLLCTLPDLSDDFYANEERHFLFDITTDNVIIDGDSEQLTIAFTELLTNCFEASANKDSIVIHSHINDNSTITVTLINPVNQEICDEPDQCWLSEQLCAPFYTTRKNHCGLGLAIVEQICCTHHAEFSVTYKDMSFYAQITFPIMSVSTESK